MPKSKGPLLYGKDQQKAILEQLRQPHEKGNPFALLEAIHLSQIWRLPLPGWVVRVIKNIGTAHLTGDSSRKADSRNPTIGRYKETLKPVVRARAYSSIMSWSRRPALYRSMPTSVIEKWYRREISPSDVNAAKAVELAVDALKDTFAECSFDRLEDHQYHNPLSELKSEIETLRDPQENRGNIPSEVKNQIRDHFSCASDIYDWSTEMPDELVVMVNLFGPPPGDPPAHVRKAVKDALPPD